MDPLLIVLTLTRATLILTCSLLFCGTKQYHVALLLENVSSFKLVLFNFVVVNRVIFICLNLEMGLGKIT